MAAPVVIELRGVGKRYLLRQDGRYWVRDLVRRLMGRPVEHAHLWALRGIDLEVREGDVVGIIGENGSGKTTLLRLLCNVTPPSEGALRINGRVAGLLELGAGFHPYLTGRENLYLNGSILGLSKREIDARFDEIVEFSGIGRFIDEPVKNYSSGMYVRLGFAIAVNLDPDILVIDEVLAVGDAEFQHKSKSKILEFRDQGKTIVLVSHDLTIIRDLCTRVYWLHRGRIREQGDIETITSSYILDVARRFGFLTLHHDELSVVFEKGKLIIFWKGIELTKNSCAGALLMTPTSWFFSDQAWWEVQESSARRFVALGRWKLLPLEQRWEVELVSPREIVWTQTLTLSRELAFTNATINLRLSDRYREWWTDLEQGRFPEEFLPGAAQRILVESKERVLGVRPFSLGDVCVPGISVRVLEPDQGILLQAMNTESFLRSRDIQAVRVEGMRTYPAGTRFTTRVSIRIEEEV
jgi:ABC-2 type transport system ATP-binding protein